MLNKSIIDNLLKRAIERNRPKVVDVFTQTIDKCGDEKLPITIDEYVGFFNQVLFSFILYYSASAFGKCYNKRILK